GSRGNQLWLPESGPRYEQFQACYQAAAHVTHAIPILSAAAQQNAASTEETNAAMQELNATINLLAEAAKDLKDIAEELEADVSFFKV
ncbi:MAG: hypothetical protein K2N98_05130, partial [Lachnospiraceae bacterium]|nr:hypothetical protein [Lachnospiraceae bacterium]